MSLSENLPEDVIVHEEIFDVNPEVSLEDIEAYSQRLGIDLVKNPGLAALVRDWILQPLPRYWFPCLDTRTGRWFYSNALNGQSSWNHPLEEIHRALAREYCNPHNLFERENPEGESAEQSMELGLGGKDPISGDSVGSRNLLPRLLAPLKRPAKPETTTLSSKTLLSPIISRESEKNQEPESSSDGGLFKTTNPIRSLLPNDILFESKPRPTSSVIGSRPIPPISPISRESDKSSFLLAYEQRDEISKFKKPNSETVQQSESISATKASTGLSFTERLAAKKASRSKANAEPDKSVTATKPLESNLEKKRVQFDQEKDQIMHYTPENSEEQKISDKSESSSSSDLLDFVGDPKDLKPFKDTGNLTFEEKRWDVKLTSFSSSDSSPVKALSSQPAIQIEDIGDEEMVTAFTSEYCPSPLPAKATEPETHATEIAAMFIEESTSSIEDAKPCQESSLLEPVLELDILTNIPAPIIISEEPPRPLSQMMPDISSSTTTLTDVPIKEEALPDMMETNLALIEPVKQKETEPKEEEAVKLKKPFAVSAAKKKLTRSVSRCDSIEHSNPSVLPVIGNEASSPPLPVIEHLSLTTNEKHLVEDTNDCQGEADSISSHRLPILSSDSSSLLATSAQSDERKISLNDEEKKDQKDPAVVTSHEELLRVKQEMESAMESEKTRLENWFKEEISQIKCQFEKELASERERTESLTKLVHSAKSEKEEAAKLELVRMQETLAKLVEEKTREVQARLNDGILQTASKASVCRQDANIQTEERKVGVTLEKSTITEKDNADVIAKSHRETQVSPVPPARQDSWMKCQCDSLQKQVARVEREMQLLKQKNLSFQKSAPVRKKSTPVKAQRESWWVDDSDESTTSSTSCSYSELRPPKNRRSRSLSNLQGDRRLHSSRKSKHSDRGRDVLSRSQTPRRSQWMEDISPDQSTDTVTSGVSSSGAGEWDSVLNSIHKISDDIHEVWSHIGRRPRPLSCLPSQRFTDSFMWTSTSTPIYQGNRVPLHWSLSGSTAERTQALKLWLQQNNSHHSQLLYKPDQP